MSIASGHGLSKLSVLKLELKLELELELQNVSLLLD